MKPFRRREPENKEYKDPLVLRWIPLVFPEKGLTEIINLLAEKEIGELTEADFEAINNQYGRDVRKRLHWQLSGLLRQFIHYHIQYPMPNEGIDYLPTLIEFLGIREKKVQKIWLDEGKRLYKAIHQELSKSRRMGEEEWNYLENLQEQLGFSDEIIGSIMLQNNQELVERFIAAVMSDNQISPVEDAEEKAMMESLRIKLITDDEETSMHRYYLRLMWRINHEPLPFMQVEFPLDKNENAYHQQTADLFELWLGQQSIPVYEQIAPEWRRYAMGEKHRQSLLMAKRNGSGTVVITGKRLVWFREKTQMAVPLARIRSIVVYKNGVKVVLAGQKDWFLRFTKERDIFAAILNRVVVEYY